MKTKEKTEKTPYIVLSQEPALDMADITVADNARKSFDEKALKELADNIKAVGVLQPIIVRPSGDKEKDAYILVAGERRLRAAKMAGQANIRATIMDLTKEQAEEVQALENLHRRDLNPLEEARAFKTLLMQGVYEAEDVAGRVNKSTAYVYRAMRLLDLPAQIQELIEAGRLTPAHGHQFLRLGVADQGAMLERLTPEDKDEPFESARALKNMIDRDAKNLSEAIFPKNKAYAGHEACNGCPLNSSNQSGLFDDTEKGMCSEASCFDTKTAQKKGDAIEEVLRDLPAGVKNLGVLRKDYNDGLEKYKKAKIIPDAEIGKMDKTVDLCPEDFGVGFIDDRWGEEPGKTALVWLNPPKTAAEVAHDSNDNWKKANFIEQVVNAALFNAMYEKAPEKAGPEHIRIILDGMLEESYGAARKVVALLGGKEDDDIKTLLEKCTPKQVTKLAIVSAIHCLESDDAEAAIKTIGVDVKAIEKAAKSQAAKDWKAKLKEEAAAKKAPKAEKVEDKDEDSEGEEE